MGTNEINNQLDLHRREDPFLRLDKNIIMDARLSWKAKGILTYLLSRPQNWQFYFSEILAHSTDGRDSLRAGLSELETYGYLRKEQSRSVGRFDLMIWHVYEIPLNSEESQYNNVSTVNGFSVNGKTVNGKTVNGKTVNGKPATNKNNSNLGNDNNENDLTTTGTKNKENEIVVAGVERTLKNLNEYLSREGLEPIVNTPKAHKALEILLKMDTETLTKFALHCKSLQTEDDIYLVTLSNPTAFVITHPEVISRISIGAFPRKEKKKKEPKKNKSPGNEYELYVPPDILENLKNKS